MPFILRNYEIMGCTKKFGRHLRFFFTPYDIPHKSLFPGAILPCHYYCVQDFWLLP